MELVSLTHKGMPEIDKWLLVTLSIRNFVTLWIIKFVLTAVEYC